MKTAGRQRGFRAIILIGLLYVVAGLGFGALASAAASNEMRDIWRLAAWLASAVALSVHIGYEHYRLRSSPPSTASHVCGAVALGAFTLAVAAYVHALWGGSGSQRLLVSALVLWPLVTAVSAYLVAREITALLARKNRAG